MGEEDRAKLILSWYKKETCDFNEEKKESILKKWINICSENEEYLLAARLKKELDSLEEENYEKDNFWSFVAKSIKNFFKNKK